MDQAQNISAFTVLHKSGANEIRAGGAESMEAKEHKPIKKHGSPRRQVE